MLLGEYREKKVYDVNLAKKSGYSSCALHASVKANQIDLLSKKESLQDISKRGDLFTEIVKFQERTFQNKSQLFSVFNRFQKIKKNQLISACPLRVQNTTEFEEAKLKIWILLEPTWHIAYLKYLTQFPPKWSLND